MTPAAKAYENDRRAGKTSPDKIEILAPTDPRHPLNPGRVKANRADRRARGQFRRGRVCPPLQGNQHAIAVPKRGADEHH